MPRFVALLRGVNVGKGKRVPMAGLRALVEDLGGREVATVLNSGNVVFTHRGRSAAKHATALAEGMQRRFDVAAPVIVKSATAAYLHCPGGLLESPIAAALLGRAGEAATTRNWGTMLKLSALVR